MAKKKTKTALVQELLATGETSPKIIVGLLAKKKITVSPQQVSMIKSKMGKGKKQRGPGRPKTASNGHVDVQALMKAKALIGHTGSLEAAKQALDMRGKLAG